MAEDSENDFEKELRKELGLEKEEIPPPPPETTEKEKPLTPEPEPISEKKEASEEKTPPPEQPVPTGKPELPDLSSSEQEKPSPSPGKPLPINHEMPEKEIEPSPSPTQEKSRPSPVIPEQPVSPIEKTTPISESSKPAPEKPTPEPEPISEKKEASEEKTPPPEQPVPTGKPELPDLSSSEQEKPSPSPKKKEEKEEELLDIKPHSPVENIKNVLMENKKYLIYGGGGLILTIILIILLLTLFSGPKQELIVGTVNAGEEFTPIFKTDKKNVVFEFISPSGRAITERGEISGSDGIIIPNTTLNETGEWSVNVKSGDEIIYSSVINVQCSCLSDNDCVNKICCNCSCIIPVCSDNNDCDDSHEGTIDECLNPGSCQARCNHTLVECNNQTSDGICPEKCNRISDVDCTNCPGEQILCNGQCIVPECQYNSDCEGYSEHFKYTCINPGTCEAECVSEEIICFNDEDCGEGEICDNPGTIESECCTPECIRNSDCDDGIEETEDFCINRGSCDAYCEYSGENCTSSADCSPGYGCCDGFCQELDCANDEECDDNNPKTIDECTRFGPCNYSCTHTYCDIECYDDINCPPGQSCVNPDTCEAECCEVVCDEDSDCYFTNACSSVDVDKCVCYNPGTCSASCGECLVECDGDDDCLSGEYCDNPGQCSSACICSYTCCSDEDCDEGETCFNPGTISSACE